MNTSLRPTDRFIPWAIASFFIVLAIVLAGLCTIAFRTYTGEVTDGAYKKGLVYNTTLQEAQTQSRLGWKSNLSVTPAAQAFQIVWHLADEHIVPISDADAQAWCIRPTQAGFDTHALLKRNGKGTYQGMIALPLKGVWEVHVSAVYKGHNYQEVKTVILP